MGPRLVRVHARLEDCRTSDIEQSTLNLKKLAPEWLVRGFMLAISHSILKQLTSRELASILTLIVLRVLVL